MTGRRKVLCLVTLSLLAVAAVAEKRKWCRIDLKNSSRTCLVWDDCELEKGMRVEWGGSCIDGKIHGKGHLYVITSEGGIRFSVTATQGKLKDTTDMEFLEPEELAEELDFGKALGRLLIAAAEGMAKNADREKDALAREVRAWRNGLSKGTCVRTWQHVLTAWAYEEWFITEIFSETRVELHEQRGTRTRSASKSVLWPCSWNEDQVRKTREK